jgi:hypothetical protein
MDRRVLNLLLCWLGASAGIRLSRAEAGRVLRIGLSLGLAGKYRELANMNKRGYGVMMSTHAAACSATK